MQWQSNGGEGVRESYIERKVCEYAKEKGVLVFKCTGHKGIPDRIFLYQGRVFYIEFKAPGKKPTVLQERVHRKIREQGIMVFVIDNIEDGKKAIRGMMC